MVPRENYSTWTQWIWHRRHITSGRVSIPTSAANETDFSLESIVMELWSLCISPLQPRRQWSPWSQSGWSASKLRNHLATRSMRPPDQLFTARLVFESIHSNAWRVISADAAAAVPLSRLDDSLHRSKMNSSSSCLSAGDMTVTW